MTMMDGISSIEGSESMQKVILISKDLIMYSKNVMDLPLYISCQVYKDIIVL